MNDEGFWGIELAITAAYEVDPKAKFCIFTAMPSCISCMEFPR